MRFFQHLLSVLAGGFVSAALLGQLAASAPVASTATPASRTACGGHGSVQVSGAATINVVPDRVVIKLGIETNAATPDGVQNANLQISQRVITAIRALGVSSKDISTDYYIVEPIYDAYDSLVIKGYRINNLLAVTLGDASKTSALLVTAFNAGANRVADVQFSTSALRRYRDEARALAMRAAAEKAQALAGAAGTQMGCVLSIQENSWASYSGGWWGRNQAQMAQNTIQNADTGSAPLPDDMPLSLGKIAVRAEVQVSYSLQE